VLRVQAPWVKHFYYGTSQYYILPNVDTVVLGGTTQKNNWDTNVSQEVRLQPILLPMLRRTNLSPDIKLASWAIVCCFCSFLHVMCSCMKVAGRLDMLTPQVTICDTSLHFQHMTSCVNAASLLLVVVSQILKFLHKCVTNITFLQRSFQLHPCHVGSLCQNSCVLFVSQ